MDKKYVFVTKYFILALKLFTVVFKEVTKVFRRMTLRVDLFVSCADIRSIRPLQFFVDFKLKSNWKKKTERVYSTATRGGSLSLIRRGLFVS